MIREDWVEGKLEDLLNYIQPTNYIVDSTAYDDSYKTPVLTAGKTFILGYTDEEENIFSDLPVIIFDDFTTATKYVNFKFKVKSSAMKILVPTSNSVIMKYVYYYMQTIRHNVDTHKRYWISIFSKLNIKIAPLPEQRAIVAKIEELFSELDSGIASLKKAKEQLEVYRQAVLKAAFEGKFTNKQKKGWTEGKLGDLLNYIQPTKYIVDSTAYDDSYRTPVLTAGKTFILGYTDEEENIFSDLPVIIFDDFTTATKYVNFKFKVKSSAMKILLPTSDQVNMKYVYYYMQTIRQNVDTHKRYWISLFSKLNIEIAPLTEQKQIVQEIESRLSVCEHIEATIEEALEKAEALRQSILKKAFEGKLLSNEELEACRRESDWEPAAELLKRIKEDKKGAKSNG